MGSELNKPEYYELMPVYAPPADELVIANAAIGQCGLCGRMTTGMGGSNSQICVPCAEVIMRKQAVGAIKWDDD